MILTITSIIVLLAISAAGIEASAVEGGADGILEALFQQKIFLIAFGLTLYYTIIWSMARNGAKKRLSVALEVCETPMEKDKVRADEKYKFTFKKWFDDQKDEILVALLSSLLLIEFDDVAVELLEKYFDFTVDTDNSNWIYLVGGVLGDVLYRLVSKLKHG